MTKLADMRAVLARLDEALERCDRLRPGLTAEQLEGLGIVRRNSALMREELEDLLFSKPAMLPDPDVGRGPREQDQLDRTVAGLAECADVLNAWVGEWDA